MCCVCVCVIRRQAPKRTLTKMTVRRRQEEMLWRHSNQPITKPLLKKLMNKELESEEAVKCYLDIFCYLLLIGVL